MKEGLTYQLLFAIEQDLVMHAAPAQLRLQASGELRDFVEVPGDWRPRDLAMLIDLQANKRQGLREPVTLVR